MGPGCDFSHTSGGCHGGGGIVQSYTAVELALYTAFVIIRHALIVELTRICMIGLWPYTAAVVELALRSVNTA